MSEDRRSGPGAFLAAGVDQADGLPGVDWASLFDAVPTPCVLLDLALVIRQVNAAYLAVTGRSRASLVGRDLFTAFPDVDPAADQSQSVARVLAQAVRTRRTALMGAQRYDISPTGDPADTEVRYWTTTAVPVEGADGEVAALLYNVHDVTALAGDPGGGLAAGRRRGQELFRAAVEVAEQARLFDDTVIAERQLGLAVQDAMLPPEVPAALADRVVVRYRPASQVLHVGGDWYDVSRLDQHRYAVAVGDVVGHGLGAAVMMGQLRSALSALTLADLGPAAALSGLDRYASRDPEAAVSTAVKVIVDTAHQTLTYSSAGHLPALLLNPDGSVETLDRAAGPALALPIEPEDRPQAVLRYPLGARLLLYTDGLVERRREDIDTSVQRLVHTVRCHRELSPAALADRLIEETPSEHDDDVALLVVQL